MDLKFLIEFIDEKIKYSFELEEREQCLDTDYTLYRRAMNEVKQFLQDCEKVMSGPILKEKSIQKVLSWEEVFGSTNPDADFEKNEIEKVLKND